MNGTIAFYRDTLGFEVTAAYPDYDPEFCSLKGGGAVAMFTRAGSNGVNSLYIYSAALGRNQKCRYRGVFAAHDRIRDARVWNMRPNPIPLEVRP